MATRTAFWGTSNLIAAEQGNEVVAVRKVIHHVTTFDEVEMRVQPTTGASSKRKLLSERVYISLRIAGEEVWKDIPIFAFRKPTPIHLNTIMVGQEIELIFKSGLNQTVLVTTVWKGKKAFQ